MSISYITELDLERTCSGKIHMVIKLNKNYRNDPTEIIRVLIVSLFKIRAFMRVKLFNYYLIYRLKWLFSI